MTHSRAKERQNNRDRRFFEKDMVQPFDEKGRRSRLFEKMYGDKIYKKPISNGDDDHLI